MYELGSPISAGPLQVVQLAEDLKLALELQPNQDERDSLRAQLPTETAQALIDWLQTGAVSTRVSCVCACVLGLSLTSRSASFLVLRKC